MLVEILTLIFEGNLQEIHSEFLSKTKTTSDGKWVFDFCGCKFSKESANEWMKVYAAIEGVKELMSTLRSTDGKKRIHINAPVLKGVNRLNEFIPLVQNNSQLNHVVALILPLVDHMALGFKVGGDNLV
jgi:hypothetical protein